MLSHKGPSATLRPSWWSFLVTSCLIVQALNTVLSETSLSEDKDERKLYRPSVTAQELLKARGYRTKTFYFVSADGYQLELIRGTNPLLGDKNSQPGRLPILFVHGLFNSPKNWVFNSRGAKPQLHDPATISNLTMLTRGQFYELIREDPARFSMPLLAMNLGYEIWLLARRGYTPGSRRKPGRPRRNVADALAAVPKTLFAGGFSLGGSPESGQPDRVPIESLEGIMYLNSSTMRKPFVPPMLDLNLLLSAPLESFAQSVDSPGDFSLSMNRFDRIRQQFIDTFDPDFWDFSLDEQAEFDLPAAIEFVIKKSARRKLHLVGYSAGGAISLLSLASNPDLADKISRHVSMMPALNLASEVQNDISRGLQSYVGPLPLLFQVEPIRANLQQVCSSELAQRTFCAAAADLTSGPSAGQSPVTTFYLSGTFEGAPSREYIQLNQFQRTDTPHRFNFTTTELNVDKYGQSEPPAYDLGAIKLHDIAFYAARDDNLVKPDAVATTVSQLSVPYELNLIGDERVRFNHIGLQVGDHADELLISPAMLDIIRFEARS